VVEMVACKIVIELAKRAKGRAAYLARLADGYGLVLLLAFAVVWKGL